MSTIETLLYFFLVLFLFYATFTVFCSAESRFIVLEVFKKIKTLVRKWLKKKEGLQKSNLEVTVYSIEFINGTAVLLLQRDTLKRLPDTMHIFFAPATTAMRAGELGLILLKSAYPGASVQHKDFKVKKLSKVYRRD